VKQNEVLTTFAPEICVPKIPNRITTEARLFEGFEMLKALEIELLHGYFRVLAQKGNPIIPLLFSFSSTVNQSSASKPLYSHSNSHDNSFSYSFSTIIYQWLSRRLCPNI
jgi:hypothetical protein